MPFRIKKELLLIIFSFSLLASLHAQYKTYKKGYIVITTNDTLRGYIKEKPDYELLESLDFSPDASSTSNKIYFKKDLNGFGFDNGRIFQKILSTKIIQKDTIVKEHFQKRVLTGKIDMYILDRSARDKEYQGMEIALKSNETQKVVNLRAPIEKRIIEKGTTYSQVDNRYILELIRIKTDTISKPYQNQKKISYTRQAIIKDITAYNKLYQNKYGYKMYEEQKEVYWGFLIGSNLFIKDYRSLRVSLFREVSFIERTVRFTWMQELVYFTDKRQTEDGGSKYKIRINEINFLPFIAKLQLSPRRVTPYIIAGIGFVPRIISINYANGKEVKAGTFGVVFTTGAGIKSKIGSDAFLHAQFTLASHNPLTANIGFSYLLNNKK